MKRSRLALPPAQYKALCHRVHERDGWKCKCCGTRNNLTAHHIIFRSAGGDDASWNMVTLCQQIDKTGCHDAVHFTTKTLGQGLILLPHNFDTQLIKVNFDFRNLSINADKGVKFWFVNGWKPKRRA